MYWKLSLLTLALAVAATIATIIIGTENWGPSPISAAMTFAVVTVILAGSHLVLAGLAYYTRSHRVLSLALFVLILLISVSGAILLALETYGYLSRDKTQPAGTDLGMFMIGLVQWLVTLVLAAVVLSIFRPPERIYQAAEQEFKDE